jgi:hypothetical protein
MIQKESGYCICYYAEQNAKATALNLLSLGHQYFARSVHIDRLDELESIINDPNFNEIACIKEKLKPFLFDNLLDAIKISICFENYMKAKLLLNGFVIHKLSKRPNYNQLRKQQENHPISLLEIKAIESWKKVEGQEYFYLPGLTKQTINFTTMLEKKDYWKYIAFPSDVAKIVSEINRQRNTLHFLTGERGFYGPSKIDQLKKLREFARIELKILQNQLIDDLGEDQGKKIK